MRRQTLIPDLLSVPEVSSTVATLWVARTHRALLLGAILWSSGCQSSSLTRFFSKPQPGDTKSVLALLDKDKAGLPPASKTKSTGESLTKLLDRGQDSLSTYYKDANPAHLTEAHRSYEQVLAQESGNPEAHHGLAIVCDLQQDYASAELHYRAALENDPDNGKILGDLGYCYLLQGRLSDSQNTLIRATKLDRSNTQASKNLAYVYAKQGDYNLADSTFRQVLNDVEVRQEMARLFPNGRPEMALEGERSKLLGKRNHGITTNELQQRMDNARDQSTADWQEKRDALHAASSPALTIEQQQAEIAQLRWERDEAYRQAETRTQQSSNSPLVLGGTATQSGGAGHGMQIQPQTGSRPANTYDRQFAGSPAPGNSPLSGHRVQNEFYPDGTNSQFKQSQNGIQQVGNPNQPLGRNGQPIDQALHQTHGGIDPRTGMPWNSHIQQMDGQPQSLVPNGIGNAEPGGNASAPADRSATFEEAKRRAAMAGLGGPELMFPMPNLETGNRMAPGSGSTFNGGQFPQPQRQLPMDAAPHDLNALMQAPAGQYTVPPNDRGMLNAPSGPSFSNPNFQQPLTPQIPLDSPLGNQGMGYSDQTDAAQRYGRQQYPQNQSQGDMTITPRLQRDASSDSDPRNQLNSDLNQYGQSLQHNPAQYNPNSWNHTPTPANGLQNQPQVENPSQLITPSWNQQQLSPRLTPPPYPGRASQPVIEDQYSTQRGSSSPQGDFGFSGDGYVSPRSSSTGAMNSEPEAIYSPGVQLPAAYNSRNRTANSYGQSFNGPRITPAGQ